MIVEDIRDKLIREVRTNKDELYRSGYVDGVLDFYLDIKKELNQPIETVGVR